MIYVCDAIMGTGKSQSAIAWMNEHREDKFIYITPYLDEAARIKEGCPDLKFVEPSDKIAEFHYRKTEHAEDLIKSGRNITTTHQAFKSYTPETLEEIRNQGYTLIIDENVDVLEAFTYSPDDLQLAVDAGYIKEEDGVYTAINTSYKGTALREIFSLLKTRELVRIDDKHGALFYWTLPKELITSFKDVFILTYLFEGQSLHYFLEIYNISYEYIGIEKTDKSETGFRFSEYPGYIPEYVYHIKDILHIVDGGKLNDIGNDYYALSMHWFEKDDTALKRLKNNIYNCMRNIWSDVPGGGKLWATYNRNKASMQGKGYTKAFLTFNSRATNEYRNRTHLVYAVNLFMNVNDKRFYQKYGIEVDEDLYALSTMVQWIWRSAIRDGKEIYLYIPSSRMRKILTDWIEKHQPEINIP